MKTVVENYLGRLKNIFPSFVRFGEGSEAFDNEERIYKLKLVELWQQSVAPALADPERSSEAGNAMVNLLTKPQAGQGTQNLLNWRYCTPLAKLPASAKGKLAALVAALIDDQKALPERIDLFCSELRHLLEAELVGKELETIRRSWSPTTRSLLSFFLMLHDPAEHAVVKTREFNRALKAFSLPPMAEGPLTGETYGRIQHFLLSLKKELDLAGLAPRDMIDVQSFIWVGSGTYPSAETQYWTLGAYWDGEDLTKQFVREKRWENGYPDKLIDKVKQVAPGDRVAIKSTYTRKNDLPFNANGETVSCMDIKAIGTVTENRGDGRNLSVEWDSDFDPVTIYLYTYRSTIDQIDKAKYPNTIKWIFEGIPQSYGDLEEYYKENPTSPAPTEVPFSPASVPAKNIIYYGPPGCGKTYTLGKIREEYSDPDGTRRYRFVTFHPSMSYEEFVEGRFPVEEPKGFLSYPVKHGIFRELCEEARKNPEMRYALLIDEINRANVAKVFGELITLIEPDKRENEKNEVKVRLPYSRDEFTVPRNIDIYGSMNSADRSVALIDTALRRRFRFEELTPDPTLLGEVDGIDLGRLLDSLNGRIECLLDREHCLGHAYLISVKTLEDLSDVYANQLLPLLQEYFHDDWARVALVMSPRKGGKSEFFEQEELSTEALVTESSGSDIARGARKKTRYSPVDEQEADMFIRLYQEKA